MPYKTQYGSHYHMTEGCHGATIPCGTEGLTPCSDCCGTGSESGGNGSNGANVAAGGPPATGTSDEFHLDATSGVDEAAVGDVKHAPTSLSIGDDVTSIGMSAVADGTSLAPAVRDMTPEMVSDLIGNLDALGLSDSGLSKPVLSPEERKEIGDAHDALVAEAEQEGHSEFAQRLIDEIGEWDGPMYEQWKRDNPDRISEVRRRPWKQRRHRALDQELFDEYAKDNPAPHPEVLASYRKLGTILPDVIMRQPGYEQALQTARNRVQRDWIASGADHDADAARKVLKRCQDSRATFSERLGAEAHKRHRALEQAITKGSDPVEHEGIMYDQIDTDAFVGTCRANGVKPTECFKDASVAVRPAISGQKVVSYAGDGTEESVASGKSGYFILTKLDHDGKVMVDEHGYPNEWQVEAAKVYKKYDMSEVGEDGKGIARSRPDRASFVRVDRNIMIMVPWGAGGALVPQYIRKGGYLNIVDPTDVYGISEQDFNDTYLRRDGVRYVPPLP